MHLGEALINASLVTPYHMWIPVFTGMTKDHSNHNARYHFRDSYSD